MSDACPAVVADDENAGAAEVFDELVEVARRRSFVISGGREARVTVSAKIRRDDAELLG